MNILIFDIEITGHHFEYIKHLINYIRENDRTKNKYYFVVHPEFKKIAANENIISFGSKLSVVTVLKSEYSKLFYKKSSSTLLQKKPYEFYKILIKYAKKFNASKCLLLTLNSFLRPLIFYRPNFQIYGILFAPPVRNISKNNFKSLIFSYKKTVLTYLYSRNKKLKGVFILNDNETVRVLNKRNHTNIYYFLPDPVSSIKNNYRINIRDKYKIDNTLKIILHFGSLRKSKGTIESIRALNYLPYNVSKKCCLIIAGKPREDVEICIEESIKLVKNVQVIYIKNHVNDSEMEALFSQSDIILMPYKNNEASSGVLGHAIAANKPVISTSRGLIGELIRTNWIGELVYEVSPQEIASAINKCISNNCLYDRKDNKKFMKEHSPDNFAKTILDIMNL